jgi:type III pantothenate kinase
MHPLTLIVKLLAIDRGNSRTKVALRDENGTPDFHFFANEAEREILDFISHQSFDAAVMSSVAANGLATVAAFLESKGRFLFVDNSTPIPLKNEYATPNTLGADRIAGAVGAWSLLNKQDVLLVDAGTCINYECVVNGHYLGGAIAPGLQMRLKAMHEFTGKLPLPALPEEEIALVGNSTVNCLLSGAIWGLVGEIEQTQKKYMELYPAISLILSGGDAPYLGKYLKNSIFAPHKEVALVGLLEILKYNLNVEN